jgi:hypothetical protein
MIPTQTMRWFCGTTRQQVGRSVAEQTRARIEITRFWTLVSSSAKTSDEADLPQNSWIRFDELD